MISLKDDSVSLMGVCPQIFFALGIAETFWGYFGVDLVITSGSEEHTKHGRISLHYDGKGADVRTKTLRLGVNGEDTTNCRAAVRTLNEALGIDFDVLLEQEGKPNEHCHIEWQPKRRTP